MKVRDGQDRDDLVRQCLDVGIENLVGELDGRTDAWAADGRSTTQIPVVVATHMAATVIDVRQANEYAPGHLPHAMNSELGSIPDTSLPAGEVTVMCGHGERAMTAASLVASRDNTAVSVFDGGPEDWATPTGHQLESVS